MESFFTKFQSRLSHWQHVFDQHLLTVIMLGHLKAERQTDDIDCLNLPNECILYGMWHNRIVL